MNSTTQITIVDAQFDDYAALAPWTASGELQVQFVADRRSALRSARQGSSALWMINMDLPDGSGLDLCQMIAATTRSPIFLVANHYDPEQELAARALRCAMYLCKPLALDWIDQIRRSSGSHRRRPNARPTSRQQQAQAAHPLVTRLVPTLSFGGVRLPVAHWLACL